MSLLLNTIFYSKKRREVIFLLLKYKKMNINEINYYLNENSVSLLPQIKKLIDYKLVININGVYKLTPIGYIISKKIKRFVESVNSIDENINYWNNCDFSVIPKLFLSKIGNIKKFYIIDIDLKSNINTKNDNIVFRKILDNSQNLIILTNNNYKIYYEICKQRIKNKLCTKIITTKPIIDDLSTKINLFTNEINK